MKKVPLSTTGLSVPNVVMGCMRLQELSKQEAEKLIRTAMDAGVHFFDHADVYGNGNCETLFSEALGMNDTLREKIIIQSKCGIRKEAFAYYDFSKKHIMASVDGILQRLKTTYIDILLLHRPDALMEPEEIAAAFDALQASGKVKYFGVSNQNPMQIALIQKYATQKLVANQLQLSIAHSPMIDSGIAVNMQIGQSVERTNSVLDYCRLHAITVQAWSPFQKGFFEGPFLGDTQNYATLNAVIDRIAAKYGVPDTAVAVGWLTRHPANMQVVLGTTKIRRMLDACKGSELPLTREEWYEIYRAAGNVIP
ncbi:MAG: aldo/keto reductase [Prevotellaceae bacterium]|jgi:predicted oxidoreductase|nr:aldo/keto reductase [Prevotellaceae bacterium]